MSADPEIIARLQRPEDYGGVITSSKWIANRLRSQGLASDMLFTPSQLGVHPENRASYGVSEETVHLLGQDIVEAGWDQDLIINPYAVEEDPLDGYIEKYNKGLADCSTVLGPVKDKSIRAGTLTNGHVTLLLRSLLAGMPCELPGLSHESISEVAPSMAKAALEGWMWTVLHHSTRAMHQKHGIYNFLSSAKNVTVQRAENEVQVPLKVWSDACACQKSGQQIAWDELARRVCRTKPACADYVPILVDFVRRFAGDESSGFMHDFTRFHAKHVPSERVIMGPSTKTSPTCNSCARPLASRSSRC